MKSFTNDDEINDTLEEIFRVINSCPGEQRDEIIKELRDADFFPCKSIDTEEIAFLAPKDIYINNNFFLQVLKNTNAKLVLPRIQETIDTESWFQEIVIKMGINSTLIVLKRETNYRHLLPEKVRAIVEKSHPEYEISPQKAQYYKDFHLEHLGSILENLTEEVLEVFWELLFGIDVHFFSSTYVISFKGKNEIMRGSLSSSLIEELVTENWVIFNGKRVCVSELTRQEFRSIFGRENIELEKQFKFQIVDDLSNLSDLVRTKIELTESRTPEEISEAFKLLDEKRKAENIALLKEEYLIDLLEQNFNVKLTENQKDMIGLLDFSAFNNSTNQKIIFDILSSNEINLSRFNSVSELKIDAKKYFEFLLKQLLLTNEKMWISSLFKRNKKELVMSNKLKFSEDMTKYSQYEFDLSEIEETLEIDFDYLTYYKSIVFLDFDENDACINVTNEYILNLSYFKELLNRENINNESLSAMLNFPSQKSLMYLGEFDELLKRYKSFIREKRSDKKTSFPM